MTLTSATRECACSVVIVGYQGERWLPACLATLRGSSAEPMRLILVDNGGNGDIGRLPLDQFQTQVLTAPRRMGFAEANNFALQQAPPVTRAVAFLNQDTLSQPGWLEACIACLDRDPGIGAISPLLLNFDGTAYDPGFQDCVRNLESFPEQPSRPESYPAFLATGQVTAAAVVVRTDALHRSGPFDPIFGSYYEDYDLCRRIREAGYQVGVCGGAVVHHFSGSSTTDAAAQRRRMRQIIRNRAILNIRLAGHGRVRVLLRQFCRNLPWNLARGLARTPTSQPPLVQLGAHADLLRLVPRLSSWNRDHQAWLAYLRELGWPELPAAESRSRPTETVRVQEQA